MSGAAVIVHRQNQLLRRFRDAGATSPQHARTLEELSLRSRWLFRRMAGRGVFVPVPPNRWYLDPASGQRFEQRRRRVMLITLGVCAIIVVLWLLLR